MNETLLLAVGAGVLAAFNPCGFALLPAYLGLVVAPPGAAADGDPGRAPAVVRGLVAAAGMTAGFMIVFGAFGLVAVPLALSLGPALSWATIVVGVLLVGLGLYLLSGRELLVRLPKLGADPTGGALAMVGYGIAYAVASLSCTIAPFLAITSTTFRSDSFLAGIAVFLAYAAGMGLVVGVLAVAVSLARDGLVRRLRRVLPYVSRASGGLLVLAGAYVAWYGAYELRVLGGGSVEDPVVDAALGARDAVLTAIERIGGLSTLGWVLAGLVLVGSLGAVARAVTRRTEDPPDDRGGAPSSPRPLAGEVRPQPAAADRD